MLDPEWLQAFVPLGSLAGPDQWSATGAGVLFAAHDIVWLITAAHVVDSAGADGVAALVPGTGRAMVVFELGRIHAASGVRWIRDDDQDLAVSPFPVMPGVSMRTVSRQDCISVRDVVPSMPSYTVGCPYGLAGVDPGRPAPLVLDGVISGVDIGRDTLYTSAPTFPGNSGGPCVVYRTGGTLAQGSPVILLAGIVLDSAVIPPRAPGGLPPLHLGVVRSTDAILRLLDTAPAKELAAKLRQMTD